jgi:hypothetical protein
MGSVDEGRTGDYPGMARIGAAGNSDDDSVPSRTAAGIAALPAGDLLSAVAGRLFPDKWAVFIDIDTTAPL